MGTKTWGEVRFRARWEIMRAGWLALYELDKHACEQPVCRACLRFALMTQTVTSRDAVRDLLRVRCRPTQKLQERVWAAADLAARYPD